jgi:hypothetical protein
MLARLLTLLLIAGFALPPVPAQAGDRWERRQERREERLLNRLAPEQPLARMSPAEAARIAQMQNGGGRVLEVEPSGDGWRVRLVKEGEVRTVFVPGHR